MKTRGCMKTGACLSASVLGVQTMSNYDIVQVIHHATNILCGNTGSMEASQLYGQIAQRFDMTEEDFSYMLDHCGRFEAVVSGDDWDAGPVVVAKTSLRLCKDYRKNNCSSCQELHICKYYVYGNCRFGRNGKRCKLSHDIHSEHNQPVLLECTLHDLHQDGLFLLLLQNDPSLLPEVCAHYNKGTMPHGQCTFRESCTKLHLCAHHIRGDCLFGRQCQRPHAIDQHARQVLRERGLCSGALVQDLPAVYRNRQRLAAPPAPDVGGADAPDVYGLTSHVSKIRSDPMTPAIIQTDERNICLHFLHKKCQFENQCMHVHFNLPYKWEVLDGCVWHDLGNMEEIELAFCDPSASQSPSTPTVDFVGMTMCDGSLLVRRLSTPSSVSRPPHYRLTTEWAWYYEEHRGSWVEYGRPDSKQRTTSVTSRDLEQAYQRNRLDEVKLMRGFREYILSFRDMYQRNLAHKTKRHVRRRPDFHSALLMQMAQ